MEFSVLIALVFVVSCVHSWKSKARPLTGEIAPDGVRDDAPRPDALGPGGGRPWDSAPQRPPRGFGAPGFSACVFLPIV